MKELPPDFLATLRRPVLRAADLDTKATFFKREEVLAFYSEVANGPQMDDVLRASAALLPDLHPHRAALLALLCGALVEDGADPRLVFSAARQLMGRLLASLEPFCATKPQEDDDDEEEGSDLAIWRAANAAFAAMRRADRFQVKARQRAVDILVLPLMAMIMRDVRNHRELLADGPLAARIEEMAASDTVRFDQLHFLRDATRLGYEDELAVVLPTSSTGMIVRAHGINDTFHAFSLLQDLMETHAAALGIQQPPRQRRDDGDTDSAAYLWLQATAFTNGDLTDPMAWAWGEGALSDNARKHGKLVLVALETNDKPERTWTGFNRVIHSEQNAHVTLTRFLAPEEVAAFLA